MRAKIYSQSPPAGPLLHLARFTCFVVMTVYSLMCACVPACMCICMCLHSKNFPFSWLYQSHLCFIFSCLYMQTLHFSSQKNLYLSYNFSSAFGFHISNCLPDINRALKFKYVPQIHNFSYPPKIFLKFFHVRSILSTFFVSYKPLGHFLCPFLLSCLTCN